jgi:hypothetical protein
MAIEFSRLSRSIRVSETEMTKGTNLPSRLGRKPKLSSLKHRASRQSLGWHVSRGICFLVLAAA